MKTTSLGKRVLSIVLSAVLSIGLFQITSIVSNAETYETYGDYTYTVSNGEAIITGYNGSGGAVTIPSEINGYPVTSITGAAFRSCYSLTSVTIPDSVKYIGYEAFAFCTSLSSIEIPDSVTRIGEYAFSGCTSLTSVTIPDSMSIIGEGAFSECSSITEVYIGSGVFEIQDAAFGNCTSLQKVYYNGTESEWLRKVYVGQFNEYLRKAEFIFNHQPTSLEHVPAKDATCEDEGNIEYWVNPETGVYYSDAAGKNTIDKSSVVIPALGHDWGKWMTVSSPTCVCEGHELRICGRCKELEIQVIDPLGHDWDDGVVTKEATKFKDGVMTYTCTRCDVTRTEVIPKIFVRLIDTTAVFADSKSGKWYTDSVDFAYSYELMNGMTEDTFAPNDAMSRAMLVTVLWRAEGSPAPNGAAPFTDLKSNWYKDAVAWAYENEIVNGTSATTFSPNASITREQIATIIYRYAEFSGSDIYARADLSGFPDGAKVSKWARDAVSWAVAEGIISGTKAGDKTILDPKGNATRAQVATILMRYLEK